MSSKTWWATCLPRSSGSATRPPPPPCPLPSLRRRRHRRSSRACPSRSHIQRACGKKDKPAMDPCHDLEANQPVRVPDEHWMGTPKEMHERADQIMRAFEPVRQPQLGIIRFSRDGRDKTLSEKRSPHEFQSVRALPELIRRGQVVSTTADRKGRQDVRAWHKLEHGLQIGDAAY